MNRAASEGLDERIASLARSYEKLHERHRMILLALEDATEIARAGHPDIAVRYVEAVAKLVIKQAEEEELRRDQ